MLRLLRGLFANSDPYQAHVVGKMGELTKHTNLVDRQAEAFQIELIERLGMNHTCCTFKSVSIHDPVESYCFSLNVGDEVILLEQSEAAEIRAADEISNQKLQRLMALYEELPYEYSGAFEELWKTWWLLMEDFAPPVAVFWRWDGTRRPSDSKCLPIPLETLDEVESKIRHHVQRSLRENQDDDVEFA
ncbi:hypothetical protein VTL71DRAFT_2911 [Oculimacula yallundae]|uniref:Uncharacterized protein n=1 Tax=Oculimacula yallundae TaxID=86028 RepID=A0ABR4C5M6_9HELO